MKFLEFRSRKTEIIKKLVIHMQNYENHETPKMPRQNYENHENLIIPRQNQERHEVHRIPFQNHENH